MILQRTRPPLLETPFEVFDQGVFTPNNRFFVRWHWANIPTDVNADTFRLAVHGHVNQTLSLSLKDILALPRVGTRRGEPMLRQFARVFPAARAGWRVEQWRHGQRALDRRAAEGRA